MPQRQLLASVLVRLLARRGAAVLQLHDLERGRCSTHATLEEALAALRLTLGQRAEAGPARSNRDRPVARGRA
jgi:hypothetical protein